MISIDMSDFINWKVIVKKKFPKMGSVLKITVLSFFSFSLPCCGLHCVAGEQSLGMAPFVVNQPYFLPCFSIIFIN